MDAAFYQQIAQSTAHRPIRDELSGAVLAHPPLMDDLISVALNPGDVHHHKACWILELVLEQKLEWLLPHLDWFCGILKSWTHDGAIRSVSKICLFVATADAQSPFLTESQRAKITEACFDWLIGSAKVAAKAYAMRALLQTGRSQSWVHPELRMILERGYADHSAAYRAASREVLGKIDR